MGGRDAFSGDSNGFHETPCDSGTRAYLPTAGAGNEAGRLGSATGFKDDAGLCLKSASRFEDRVDLGAVIKDLPGAGEPGRNHERIAGSEAHALTARALDDDLSGGPHAQLVLGLAHEPFSPRSRPASGEELLTAVAEVVANLQFGGAGDQPVGRRLGNFRLECAIQANDARTHGNPAQVIVPGDLSAKMRRELSLARRTRLQGH